MEGFKNILLSKTVWGVIVAILSTVAGMAGYDIGSDTEGLANDAVALAGLVFAFYGRVKAVEKLTVTAK